MRRGFLGSLAGLCLGASVALGQQLPPPRQLPAEPSTPPAPSQERTHTWSDGALAPYLLCGPSAVPHPLAGAASDSSTMAPYLLCGPMPHPGAGAACDHPSVS